MSHALCAINSVFEKFIQCLSSFKLADITANCLYRGEYFAPLCSSAISRIKVGKKNLSRSRNNIFLPVSRFALFPLPAHEAKVGSPMYTWNVPGVLQFPQLGPLAIIFIARRERILRYVSNEQNFACTYNKKFKRVIYIVP